MQNTHEDLWPHCLIHSRGEGRRPPCVIVHLPTHCDTDSHPEEELRRTSHSIYTILSRGQGLTTLGSPTLLTMHARVLGSFFAEICKEKREKEEKRTEREQKYTYTFTFESLLWKKKVRHRLCYTSEHVNYTSSSQSKSDLQRKTSGMHACMKVEDLQKRERECKGVTHEFYCI